MRCCSPSKDHRLNEFQGPRSSATGSEVILDSIGAVDSMPVSPHHNPTKFSMMGIYVYANTLDAELKMT